jgi:ribosome-associated toxin RatA of RatAB toxin-antitoxin module
MTNEIETYFEISDNGNSIRIEVIESNYPNAEMDWDKNWVSSIVSVKAGAFSGKFNADLMTIDFADFKISLKKLYQKLDGTITFNTLEDQIEMKIIGDGIGHLRAECEVMDNAGVGNKLEFDIDFDQTHIPKLLNQLEKITTKFPVLGELKK